MSRENYFNRMVPRRSLGGFRSSLTSLSNNRRTYLSPSRRFRQHYSNDTKFHPDKVFSSSSSPPRSPSPVLQTVSSPIPSVVTESPTSEPIRERTKSTSETSPQTSMDLVVSSLKCDDCQTNDGLFQCCHCSQRLCIRCCNKHYKKVTNELERLHELSDRLVAKIVHTKNDLERQKNETLEQCHKWRIDTINTINKAHTLIVQTIHDEYETLGKEYDTFVQKEMANIHIDQNELMRMKKGNLSSVLSPSSNNSAHDTTNTIDTIRKRIETFARNIDETGKFLFQVKLPPFDIDDRLRVESRFGDVTRCTSATWQNGVDTSSSSSLTNDSVQGDDFRHNSQSNENHVPLSHNNDDDGDDDVINNTNDETEEVPDKDDEQEFDIESRSTTSSPPLHPHKSEIDDSNLESSPSTRYALSVENDIELQQQRFYSPSFRVDRYDSAYGTAPSSPSNPLRNQSNHYSSTSSLHEQTSKRFTYPPNDDFGSFYNNRRHTHAFRSTSSSPPPPSSSTTYSHQNIHNTNENEDTYRSLQHVQLKQQEDGSIEGVAIQIEQSHKNDGITERRHTCVQEIGRAHV